MIKKSYQKEIEISDTQSIGNAGNNRKDVTKIQCWLNLFARKHPASGAATAIDGDFGQATETAVKNFQKAIGEPETGVVDKALFKKLCQPMINAFEAVPQGATLREKIVDAATIHLNNGAFELTIKGQTNSGPWVRSYMDGSEGTDFLWCMGFVQTMIDQAASAEGKDFRKLMPQTFSCDTVGTVGQQKGLLTRSAQLRKNPAIARPGDIFLLPQAPLDWFHTGLVIGVNGDVFVTIEGNTNEDGSHNGIGVFRRNRNFMKSAVDLFSIQPLV